MVCRLFLKAGDSSSGRACYVLCGSFHTNTGRIDRRGSAHAGGHHATLGFINKGKGFFMFLFRDFRQLSCFEPEFTQGAQIIGKLVSIW